VTKNEADLIRYRLSRSTEAMEEARVMLKTGHPYGAVNRIYYACFYATTSLLLTRKLSIAKHSGVLGLFNYKLWVSSSFHAAMTYYTQRQHDIFTIPPCL
jgi:uncharacterized protein (UPF0332 family)